MLTPAEKRFIRSWEEQRKGGKWPYYFLYFVAASFISTIMLFIVLLFFMQLSVTPLMLLSVPATGIVLGAIIPAISWNKNEKRWKMIIRREINNATQ